MRKAARIITRGDSPDFLHDAGHSIAKQFSMLESACLGCGVGEGVTWMLGLEYRDLS